MKRNLLYSFWGIAVVLLLFFASRYKDSSSAILAEVEPEKHAISFQKAIRVQDIYVVPGQHVKMGDALIKVERPDLRLDADKLENELLVLENDKAKKEIERRDRKAFSTLEYDMRMSRIETELSNIRFLLSGKQHMAKNLQRLNLIADSLVNMDHSYLQGRQAVLEQEKISLGKKHKIETAEIEKLYQLDDETISKRIEQVRKEMNLLRLEESELIQYSAFDGTIGNISCEEGELATPYTTLLTLYEENPTIIRALMSEHQHLDVQSGDIVVVESTNRKHKVNGNILEVGSRVIEYPSRLRRFREVPMWGRELFIKIPEEGGFYNGEKVFVILKKKS